eukprot:3690566-Amphidinium_carterae.4
MVLQAADGAGPVNNQGKPARACRQGLKEGRARHTTSKSTTHAIQGGQSDGEPSARVVGHWADHHGCVLVKHFVGWAEKTLKHAVMNSAKPLWDDCLRQELRGLVGKMDSGCEGRTQPVIRVNLIEAVVSSGDPGGGLAERFHRGAPLAR